MGTTFWVVVGVLGVGAIATVISVVYFIVYNKKMKNRYNSLRNTLEERLNTPGSQPLTLDDARAALGKPKKNENFRAVWKWYSVAHSGGSVRVFADYDSKKKIISLKLEDDAQDEYRKSLGRDIYIDNDGVSPERFLLEYNPNSGRKKREGVVVFYNKTKKMYYITQTNDVHGKTYSILTSKSKEPFFMDLKSGDEFLIKIAPLLGSKKKTTEELEKFIDEIYGYNAVKYSKIKK